MVRVVLAPIFAAAALFSGASAQSCDDGSATVSVPASADASYPTNWFIAAEAPTYNNNAVSQLLSNLDNVRKTGEAYATFDWDNTCMYGDISYTSVSYQVENLVYRIPPAQFETVLSLGYDDKTADVCMPQGINSVIGQDTSGKNVTAKQAIASASADYKTLYDSFIAAAASNASPPSMTLDAVKNTDAYKNFRAKIAFVTYGLEAMTGGDERSNCSQKIAMTVFPQLLVGMTDAEIRAFIRSSVRFNLATGLSAPSYTSTGDLAVTGSYSTGLRVFNGQETTMRALRQQGAAVYIISASPEIFADEAADLTGLTYLVPKSNVYGVRFTYGADGKFTGQLESNYPITWGPGKAVIVETYLKPTHNGQPPIYASGDSSGDCDFLATVRDGIVHVNNRLHTDCIKTFYEKACEFFGGKQDPSNNRYLLQGQDKAIGSWIPTGATTIDGASYTVGTTTYTNCSGYSLQQQ